MGAACGVAAGGAAMAVALTALESYGRRGMVTTAVGGVFTAASESSRVSSFSCCCCCVGSRRVVGAARDAIVTARWLFGGHFDDDFSFETISIFLFLLFFFLLRLPLAAGGKAIVWSIKILKYFCVVRVLVVFLFCFAFFGRAVLPAFFCVVRRA